MEGCERKRMQQEKSDGVIRIEGSELYQINNGVGESWIGEEKEWRRMKGLEKMGAEREEGRGYRWRSEV